MIYYHNILLLLAFSFNIMFAIHQFLLKFYDFNIYHNLNLLPVIEFFPKFLKLQKKENVPVIMFVHIFLGT